MRKTKRVLVKTHVTKAIKRKIVRLARQRREAEAVILREAIYNHVKNN